MKLSWKITTLNANEDIRFYTLKEIHANKNNKGYWKQSIACKIASLGYYDMKTAWCIFKLIYSDYIVSNEIKKAYSLSDTINAFNKVDWTKHYHASRIYTGD